MSRIIDAQKQFEQRVDNAFKTIKSLNLPAEVSKHYLQICMQYALDYVKAEPRNATKIQQKFEMALQQPIAIHN